MQGFQSKSFHLQYNHYNLPPRSPPPVRRLVNNLQPIPIRRLINNLQPQLVRRLVHNLNINIRFVYITAWHNVPEAYSWTILSYVSECSWAEANTWERDHNLMNQPMTGNTCTWKCEIQIIKRQQQRHRTSEFFDVL